MKSSRSAVRSIAHDGFAESKETLYPFERHVGEKEPLKSLVLVPTSRVRKTDTSPYLESTPVVHPEGQRAKGFQLLIYRRRR